ncbi:MAG: alginate O-acetyltransferase AlgX-related protein [Phenylobacterium sp.]|uniref:alginate O-acetyltransferase AlgX-related protein n=1 Tax=Phenylobacterium sp. TaxID=1871053 RepID=UPI00391B703E
MTPAAHWRTLVAATVLLMAAAMILPRFLPEPDLRENRTLAPAPTLPRSLAGLDAFRAEADAYVADHFPPRSRLIAAFNYLRLPFRVSGSERVIVGREGWLYYNDGSHMGPARGLPPLAPEEAEAQLAGLAGRTEALRARGTPYLVVAAPVKETLYPQYAPAWYDGPSEERASVRLAAMAERAQAGEVLYMHAPLAAAVRAGVKTHGTYDTHWTGAGAHAAYVVLMRRLQQLGVVDEPARPLIDFSPLPAPPMRDLAQMLGVGGFLKLEDWILGDPLAEQRRSITYLTDNHDWTGAQVIDTGVAGKPTALITIDSFGTALLPLLTSHFSRIVVAHNQDGAWRQDLIDRYAPDVVILEVIETGLRFSLQPAPPASDAALARIRRTVGVPAGATGGAPRAGVFRRAATGDPTLQELATAEPAAACNPEAVTVADGRLRAEGWITNLGRRPGREEGFLRLTAPDGFDYLSAMQVARDRPDVAEHFHQPAARNSGFAADVDLADVAPGRYGLVIYRRAAARWIYCAVAEPVTVP